MTNFKLESITLILVIISMGLKKNALTILLTLEILVIIIIIYSFYFGLDFFFGLILICVGACEGAVGLSALICMSRTSSQHLYVKSGQSCYLRCFGRKESIYHSSALWRSLIATLY